MSQRDLIAVIDCGGRDIQKVARKIRAAQVYCEIFSCDMALDELAAKAVAGIVLVGDRLQPHPELTAGSRPVLVMDNLDMDSPQAENQLRRFLFDVCRCRADWTPASFTQEVIQSIQSEVGAGRAIAALSGGVDSLVAATLVHRAIGDRLHCIFVDHGFMRSGEAEQVLAAVTGQGLDVVRVDSQQRFLNRLRGVSDPEQKRKIIGEEFIRVFEEEAEKLGPVDFLVQGTVYTDVIESGVGGRATVKSHHNVGGLPERMRLRLIEPLRQLFKDEVRQVGLYLGLPDDLVWRHPFPGPGLAIRVIGEITEERLDIARRADAVVVDEIKRAGVYRQLWQCFAVLTPARTVGVDDGRRTYGHTVAVRAVTGDDGMTATWARLDHDLIDRIASRIIAEVPGVNRVVYDVTSKPPATIEWE